MKEERERRAKAMEKLKSKSVTPAANESAEVETPRSITSAENAAKSDNGADYKDSDPFEGSKQKESVPKVPKKKDLLGGI